MNRCNHCGGELNTAYICVKCGKTSQPISDTTSTGTWDGWSERLIPDGTEKGKEPTLSEE